LVRAVTPAKGWLMAGVLLSHATDFADEQRRASFSALFSTLLFAIPLESSFEGSRLAV
jgi:hypothetical protein